MKRLFKNGKIYVDRGDFASWILTEGEKISKVGYGEEYPKGAEEVVDLEGRTVIPGLNDSHCHISYVGAVTMQVPLNGTVSIDDVVERSRTFLKEHPEVEKTGFRGWGWNQDLFTEGEKRNLTKNDLDRISTEVPIVLDRACGHICTVNSKVLEILNITSETKVPEGGTMVLGEDGEPNGIFTENAGSWVKGVIPEFTWEQKVAYVKRALDYAQSVGVTSIQSNDVGAPGTTGSFELLREVYESGEAKVRNHMQICAPTPKDMDRILEEEAPRDIYHHNRLTIGPIKMFKDGSLGASTALMRKGYHGDPENKGVLVVDGETQERMIREADKRGFQVVTHVIGDGAVEETVAAYEKVLVDGKNPRRHGLIHCQITDRPLLERIAKDDITVFYQPIFLDYDLHIVEDRVGKELARTSYAFKTMEDLGGHVAYGTDAPVEDINPFPCIYAAVTRMDKKGFPKGGFVPEEKVDVYEAIDAYTAGSAYVQFMEDVKGRLKEGFLADFVVLNRDIFTVEPEEIKEITPVRTVIGGETVFVK